MKEQIIIALNNQDYTTAKQLIAQLINDEPQNPWGQFYLGKLYHLTGNIELAETTYKKVLRNTTIPKLISQTRQALQELINQEKEHKRQKLTTAINDPNNKAESVLILEPITKELKAQIIPKFAKIMEIDPYMARMILPSKSWRLYRTGNQGEMGFYVEELTRAQIPCFQITIDQIQNINVYNVHYFHIENNQLIAVCEDHQEQIGNFAFQWSEIQQTIEGLLPLFEQVAEFDARRQMQHKTQILDYVHIWDLHLPKRNTILRICDRSYKFSEGINISQPLPLHQNTIRINWNNLSRLISSHLENRTIYKDFTNFAEIGLEEIQMLKPFASHIKLFRQEESLWDQAFQLYSGLVFLKY
jgi:tetratricopeptide (TPR) repeat protein